MRILVTNDDGVDSPGILALARALEPLGQVTVVAPSDQQSAIAHSITIFQPLTVARIQNGRKMPIYAVDGTPADCVKIAVCEILREKPDFVVSGINHGGNVGINVIYSGTVAGAMEGAILGIPSFAVSLDTHEKARFDGYARLTARWIREHARTLLREPIAYNVNIPFRQPSRIKGFAFTRQLALPFMDRFHRRIDPRGRTYFWLGADPMTQGHWDRSVPSGEFTSDYEAIRDGWVSVTPLAVDRTNYSALGKLSGSNGRKRR